MMMLTGTLTAIALGLNLAGSAHITPTVTLVKRADAVRQLLTGATKYFVREVKLDRSQVDQIDTRVNWVPEDKKIRFFVGRDGSGQEIGSVLLLNVDSRHGPVALAVGFTPDGSIGHVVVTAATEETLPWVHDVIESGALSDFEGMSQADADPALKSLQDLGAMQRYMGRVIARGVERAIAIRAAAYKA